MRTAFGIGGAASGRSGEFESVVNFAVEAEKLGVDVAWSAEAWGYDAVAPLAYLATLSPKALELTGELADGWLGTVFIPEQSETFFSHIRTGAERAGRTLDDIELQAGAGVWFTDDVDEALKVLRVRVAFSLGGMGSRDQNFYNAAYSRQGYADAAKEVQRLWLEGRRDEAREAVPLELAQKVNLVGTDEMVKERLRVYRDIGIDQLYLQPHGDTIDERLETLGRVMDLVNDVNAEK